MIYLRMACKLKLFSLKYIQYKVYMAFDAEDHLLTITQKQPAHAFFTLEYFVSAIPADSNTTGRYLSRKA